MDSAIRSSLRESRIGFGMAAIGRPGYITINHGIDVEDPSFDAMEQRALSFLSLTLVGLRNNVMPEVFSNENYNPNNFTESLQLGCLYF